MQTWSLNLEEFIGWAPSVVHEMTNDPLMKTWWR